MNIHKVVYGRIEKPTNFKLYCVEHEYNGFQKWMIMGIDDNIYSYYKPPKYWNRKNIKYREYPLILSSQITELKKQINNKIAKYWLRFRTKLKRGGIWLPLKLYQPIPDDCKLCDSKMIYNHKKGWYEVMLIFEKEFKSNGFTNVLAIDIGEKVMATVVSGNQYRQTTKPVFLGRNVRGVRRHYNWLRKQLQKKNLMKKIKQIGNKEKRVVENILHHVSKKIVNIAIQNNIGFIFIGNLYGIRDISRGKRFNRIVSNMPFYKLSQMIEYKANWNGINVVYVDESFSSITCSKCNNFGKRVKHGLFKCVNCGYEVNADYNGSKNILKRGMDYIFVSGVSAYAHNYLTKDKSIFV